MTSKVEMEAGGMEKEPIFLSRAMPCSMNIDEFWEYTVENMIEEAQMGKIRISNLSSSICVTVQSFHGLEKFWSAVSVVVIMAALSKNLY